MCLASLSDYDRETQRQICALKAMLAERRRKELVIDAGIRARANRFMPAAVVDMSPPIPCMETAVAGTYREKAA
jgi:hypothetical protein